jgi:flagellar hook-associated protein 1 FlgK
MGQVSLFGIGVSGLKAAQLALSTAGHNVSNANTEGYSRQRVEFSARNGAFTGSGFQGAGVQADDVARVADRYLTGQIRLDTAALEAASTYLDNAGTIDNLLADEQTGLAPGLDKFFASMQEAAADPTSIPARRLVISEAGSLAARLHTLHDRLTEQDANVTGQLDAAARQVSSYAQGIAQLNLAIQRASGDGGGRAPNDLLDQRDDLLRKLAQEVDVSVVNQSDGLTNVFIGSGQVLVVGGEAKRLTTDPGSGALLLDGSGGPQDVTAFMSGGRIGGLLRFRDDVLTTTFNGLGRTAQVLSQVFNAQHREGVDLQGNFGGPLFRDINAVAAASDRVERLRGAEDADVRLFIDDATRIGSGDYELRFNGPSDNAFEVHRLDDGAIVGRGNADDGVPVVVQFDNLRVELHAGSFTAGDAFALRPSRFGARDFGVALTDPAALALASPLRVSADLGNGGTGKLEPATVLDAGAPAFATPGRLAPPLLIQFTSATSYDVLDASDPASPRPLSPPLRNLAFVPGVGNDLLPGANGEQLAPSDGARAARLPAAATTVRSDAATGSLPGNGYLAEQLTFSVPTVNASGAAGVSTQTIRTEPAASARSVAETLNTLRGVSARADSVLTINSISRSGTEPGLVVTLNGSRFSGDAVASVAALADAITADGALAAAGIRASSDGSTLTLRSLVGDDLRVGVIGDAGDVVQLEDRHGNGLDVAGAGIGGAATIGGAANLGNGFDFRVGGPYTFSLAVDGGAARTITLDNDYADGVELVAGLQGLVDGAVGAGRVTVAIGVSGSLTLSSTRQGATASLQVDGAPPGSSVARALGLSDRTASGHDLVSSVVVGGDVQLVLDEGIGFDATVTRPGGSLFRDTPTRLLPSLGYQVGLSGRPAEGDRFLVGFNGAGTSDNRNGLALGRLQSAAVVGGGVATLADSYGEVVQVVGSKTGSARLDHNAAEGLLQQSTELRNAYSGVDLDEEAAALLRFEQAYTASARVISTARTLFDSLLSIFN